jgi:RNA polymerase sigma-70 factor, ECF subfamily
MIPAEARGAWREIEGRLRPYVARRLGPAAEVDDVVQEILIRIHQGLASLRDGQSFGGWAYRIAGHAISDALRAKARAPIPAKDLGEGPDAAGDEESDLQLELGECIALFVARLPSPYREAVTLTDLQGLTQKDAAEMLGVSVSGMKSRVQRGREKIRQMFEECCEISVDCRGRVVQCAARELQQIPEDCRGAAESWAARHGAKTS